MRLLVSGEGGELLQAGLDVVAQLPFPTLDGAEVDSIDHRAVVVDDLLGDVEALVALRPRTAIHSRRSSTIRCSGENSSTISGPA